MAWRGGRWDSVVCGAETPAAPTTPRRAQIFVEIERARLTRRLAAMKEKEGLVSEAADILQEVPVVRGRTGRQPAGLLAWCPGVDPLAGEGEGRILALLMRAGASSPLALQSCCRGAPTRTRTQTMQPAGDVWRHGQDGEDRLHPGASAPVPGQAGLYPRADPQPQDQPARLCGEEGRGQGRDWHRGHRH